MGKHIQQFWKLVEDYGNDETRGAFAHSGSYHRHFQGYAERVAQGKNGKGRRIERVYTADYWKYAEPDRVWRRKKILYPALYALSLAAVILGGSRQTAVNRTPLVGAAQMLSFVPLIYLAYTLILQITADRLMTVGEHEASSGGLRRAALLGGIALLAVAAFEIVSALLEHRPVSAADWEAILLELVGAVSAMLLFSLEKTRKAERVPNSAEAPRDSNIIW